MQLHFAASRRQAWPSLRLFPGSVEHAHLNSSGVLTGDLVKSDTAPFVTTVAIELAVHEPKRNDRVFYSSIPYRYTAPVAALI